MKLSIIIVSYNTCEITCQCLKSIYSSKWDIPFEIILVDNNSQDNTLECIQRDFLNVKIIANTENKLFAIANNQAAAIAKGEYLLLLNSDTIIEDDNICKLIHYMDKLPEKVVCIGPKILNLNKTIQSQGFMFRGNGGSIVEVLGLHKLLPDTLTQRLFPAGISLRNPVPRKVGWVSGCCMLIRTSYYQSTNGLNEELVFYGEEPEFSWRAKKNNKETWYYPDSHIVHLGGISTNKDWADKIDFQSHIKLIKLTTGVRAAFLEAVVLVCIDVIKFILTLKKKYREHAKAHGKYVKLYFKNMLYTRSSN